MHDLSAFILLTYTIAFGLQNKADFLRGKHPFLDRLLVCTYCTGFHAGWMSWCLLHASPASFKEVAAVQWGIPFTILTYALIGAGSSYTLDALIRWFEGNTPASTS